MLCVTPVEWILVGVAALGLRSEGCSRIPGSQGLENGVALVLMREPPEGLSHREPGHLVYFFLLRLRRATYVAHQEVVHFFGNGGLYAIILHSEVITDAAQRRQHPGLDTGFLAHLAHCRLRVALAWFYLALGQTPDPAVFDGDEQYLEALAPSPLSQYHPTRRGHTAAGLRQCPGPPNPSHAALGFAAARTN